MTISATTVGPPKIVYMLDDNDNLLKGNVIEVSITNMFGSQPRMCIECEGFSLIQKPSLKDVDADVFQALLEDGYGRRSEIS